MASSNVENYLKNIYKLQAEEGLVSTSSLSGRLQISPASVSEMIRKLAEEGHLTHTPYKGVELTHKGKRKALQIIRRHRLWEMFLVEVLKFDWDEIDEEAELLEHSTSERLERRIDALLGHPRRDPHGHVIPSPEGNIEAEDHVALSELREGERGIIRTVNDDEPDLLKYLARLGMSLDTKLTVVERIAFDGTLRVDVDGAEHYVSAKLARHVFVEPLARRREMAAKNA